MKQVYDDYLGAIFKFLHPLDKKEFEDGVKLYEAAYGKFMPSNKNSRILDIGCGPGKFLYYLKRKGFNHYYGIDLSPQLVEICREKVTPNVEIADVFEFLPDKTKSFDLIVATHLLEHIPKDKILPLLKLVYDSLDEGGRLIVSVPNAANLFGSFFRYVDFTHEVSFTEYSLYEVLYTAGFRDILILPPSPPRMFKSFAALIPKFFIYNTLKFLYLVQGYNVPKILSPLLIGIADKKAH